MVGLATPSWYSPLMSLTCPSHKAAWEDSFGEGRRCKVEKSREKILALLTADTIPHNPVMRAHPPNSCGNNGAQPLHPFVGVALPAAQGHTWDSSGPAPGMWWLALRHWISCNVDSTPNEDISSPEDHHVAAERVGQGTEVLNSVSVGQYQYGAAATQCQSPPMPSWLQPLLLSICC